jgi:hypothetical protein
LLQISDAAADPNEQILFGLDLPRQLFLDPRSIDLQYRITEHLDGVMNQS